MTPFLLKYFSRRAPMVDATLKTLMRPKPGQPETIRRAMSYSLFAGGKRLRPILTIAAAELCGLGARRVLKAAAAVEMIHTYSLIHDDLPAMDDDDLRRGRPTNHKVFGEAMAILAGDGLLTYAFEVAADNAKLLKLPSAQSLDLIQTLARGAGTQGMVAGQVADLEAEDWKAKNHGFDPAKALRSIHERKTAALIAASLESGAILAQAGKSKRAALSRYGQLIGLAFQIADDVLDVVGDKKKLGKSGSDRQNNKLTYASLYGVEKAQSQAAALIASAHKTISPLFGAKARVLNELADHIVQRDR